jgi:hypothetical protein
LERVVSQYDITEAEAQAAYEDCWNASHPICESCQERGCAHDGPFPCIDCNLTPVVQLTDGLIFHPACLVKEQAADAAFGNVEYRR